MNENEREGNRKCQKGCLSQRCESIIYCTVQRSTSANRTNLLALSTTRSNALYPHDMLLEMPHKYQLALFPPLSSAVRLVPYFIKGSRLDGDSQHFSLMHVLSINILSIYDLLFANTTDALILPILPFHSPCIQADYPSFSSISSSKASHKSPSY